MDRLKFNEMKKTKKRRQICLNDGVGLRRRFLIFSIFNLSIENTVLLREMRMDSMKVSKCLFEMLTIKERYRITHLCTLFFDCFSVGRKFRPCVGSSDTCRKFPVSSDWGFSAS
jgi:hypothetical protein